MTTDRQLPTTIRMGTPIRALRWEGIDLLPAGTRRLLDGFAELATAAGRADDVLSVRVSGNELPASYAGLGIRPPVHGPMADLPPHPAIHMDAWDDLLTWAWRGAGMLAGTAGSGRATFHPASGQRDTSWMVGQLTGTILYLLAAAIPVHATAMMLRQRTVLLLGGSGSGKTTLGLMLALCGGRILADDFVYLGRCGRMLNMSIRRHLTMRRGTWQALGPRLEQWWGSLPMWANDIGHQAAFRQYRTDQIYLAIDPIEYAAVAQATGHVDAALLPSIRPGMTGYRIWPCEPGQLVHAWRRGLDQRMLHWPEPFLAGTQGQPAKFPPLSIPAFHVRLGLDYGERLEELQQALLAELDRIPAPARTA